MDVSIVIVNWEADDQLRDCLQSINRTVKSISYEVFILDNNSDTINFEEIADDFAHISEFEFVSLDYNRGAVAINEVQRRLSGKYILFLGPDVVLLPDTVHYLFNHLEQNEDIGAVTAKLLNPDWSDQKYYYRFWDLSMVFYTHTIFGRAIDRFAFNSRKQGYYYGENIKLDSNTTIDQPPAACLLARREIIDDESLIDPKFEFYFNDVDICRRIYNSGYKIELISDAEVIHDQGSSFAKRQSVWSRYNMLSDMVEYFRKHYHIQAILVEIMIFVNLLIRIPIVCLYEVIMNYDLAASITQTRQELSVLYNFSREVYWK